jgi:hypothetical protein
MDMGRTKDLIIGLHNASAGGQGLAGVAGSDPVGQPAAGRFGVLAHVPVIARARACRSGR